MKGIVKLTLVGFMVLGMMVGTSMASEIDIQGKPSAGSGPVAFDTDVVGQTSGAVTVDQRWVATGTLDFVNFNNSATWPNTEATGSERAIAYYSSVALNTDSTLKFTLAGTTVKPDATLFLLAWVTSGGTAQWMTAASLTDWDIDANGGTYEWIRFQISTIAATTVFWGKSPTTGQFGFLDPASTNALPAGTVLVLSGNNADAANAGSIESLGFIVDQSASGNITIIMDEARDNNAQPLSAPNANAETIMVVGAYSVAKIQFYNPSANPAAITDGPATSTIDVEASPSRTLFVDEGRTGHMQGADTDENDSEAGLLFTNTAEYGLKLTSNDTFALTVKRGNVSGVDVISLYDGSNYQAMVPGANQWTRTSNFSIYDLSAVKGIDIHVGTQTPPQILATGTWTVDLTVNFSQDSPEPKSLGTVNALANADSHIWGINGSQFIVPYMNSDAANYGTYMIITNTGAIDASLYADVWTDGGVANGNSAVTQTATNINIGTVYGNSTRILLPADIEGFVNTALGGAPHGRYLIKVIAIAPNNTVHVTAMQNNGNGGKRSIPVLTDEEHEWKE